MSFLEEAKAKVTTEPPRCGVGKWLTTQPDVTTSILRESAERFTIKVTHLAMVDRGFPLQRNAVERHLQGKCSCPVS